MGMDEVSSGEMTKLLFKRGMLVGSLSVWDVYDVHLMRIREILQ